MLRSGPGTQWVVALSGKKTKRIDKQNTIRLWLSVGCSTKSQKTEKEWICRLRSGPGPQWAVALRAKKTKNRYTEYNETMALSGL